MNLINEIFIGSISGKTREEQMKMIQDFKEDNKKDKIKVSVLPDLVDKDLLKMLKEHGVSGIELEVQSTNGYIIKKCGHDFTMEQVKKAVRMIKWKGFRVSVQVGIGLPDSTKIDELNTAKEIAKLKPHVVRIYPMLVIKNTGLEDEYNHGAFTPLTLNQAVERCKDAIYEFNRKKIKQISIVQQNELNKSEEKEVVARTISRKVCTACN